MKKAKIFQRVMAILLTAVMLLPLVACGETEKPGPGDKDLSWLNTDGSLPLVKEGTEKTLKIAVRMYEDSGDPEDQWFYKFVETEMNINLEVTRFTATNANEFVSMIMADGDLPDIIIGAGLGSGSLSEYGEDGLIADIAPYIIPEIAPNLYKLYNEQPEYKKYVQDNNGHMWSLGFVTDPYSRGTIPRAFINYDWLEEAGLDVPKTLNEFIDMLRAFKKRGSDIIPMGGSYASNNPGLIILNALGYITEDATGRSIALRNGEPVLPVADREAYGEFLKTMNTLYTEGLIHQDFYTMDASATTALAAANRVGYMTTAPFVVTTSFSSWWGASPLTSSVNDTAAWPAGTSSLAPGNCVFSADSDNLELAVAFIDWLYEESSLNYNLATNGPAKTQTQYIYDNVVTGFDIDPETFLPSWPDYENNKSSYSSKNDFIGKEVYLFGYSIVGRGAEGGSMMKDALQYGYTADEIVDSYPDVSDPAIQSDLRKQTASDGEMHFRSALEDTMVPYVTKDMPITIYYDADTAARVNYLFTLVREYSTQESAKFITGRRPLTTEELDKYFDELDRLGAAEILQITKNYYESVK